jgi:hypothetical protein
MIVKAGRFWRSSIGQWSQRFLCANCRLRFSRATFHRCYRQKKRQMNNEVIKHLASGVSERRTARILSINRKTVARKVRFLGFHARVHLTEVNRSLPKVASLQFDDMETIEHTKMKPLSVSLAVETDTRRILGFEISRMPASGKLAKKSLGKYGKRRDERRRGRIRLLRRIRPFVSDGAVIRSDENPHYIGDMKRLLPRAEHLRFKGRKPRDHGLGELKQGAFDPLFSLNHTAAMLRYGIANLIRKTWCTTKKAERLADRIAIYVMYHNLELI